MLAAWVYPHDNGYDDKGLFINDVIIFRGYADPPSPLVIIRHFLAIPPPLLCDDVIYEPKGVQFVDIIIHYITLGPP